MSIKRLNQRRIKTKARLEAFLRRSAKLGYRAASAPTLASICAEADNKLFWKVTPNEQHLLHPLQSPLKMIITASEIGQIIISSSHSEHLPSMTGTFHTFTF